MDARTSMHRAAMLAVLALSVPALAAAQRGGGMASGHAGGFVGGGAHAMSGARVASAAPRVAHVQGSGVARAGVTSRAHSAGGTVRTTRRNNNPNNFGFNGETNFNDVPGLGFDFPHLAAVSGGRRRFGGFGGGFPFFDSGFLFGSPSVIIEQAPAAEAPAEAEDAIAGDAPEPGRNYARSRDSYRAPDPVAQAAPEPPVEQYVFVQRDGSLLYAVGYTWDRGNLRYVAPDGTRRTIGRDALDLSATEQMNEKRGLDFHAPA